MNFKSTITFASAFFILSFFASHLPAASVYWVGGSGNWSDINHWATSSGGSTHPNTVPTPADDVFFDQNSFTAAGQIVAMNSTNAYCRNMSWQGAQHSPAFNIETGTLNIFGSLRFAPNMSLYSTVGASAVYIKMLASSGIHSIDFDGVALSSSSMNLVNFVIDGSAEFNFLSDMDLDNGWSELHLMKGRINLNGNEISAEKIISSLSGANDFLDMGTGTIRCGQYMNYTGYLNFDGSSGSMYLGRLDFGPVVVQKLVGPNGMSMFLDPISDSVRVDTLIIEGSGARLSNVQVSEYFKLASTAGSLSFAYLGLFGDVNWPVPDTTLTLGSISGPTPNILHYNNDTLCLTQTWMGYVHATGSARWILDPTCVDLGNNQGNFQFGNCDQGTGIQDVIPNEAATISPTVLKPGQNIHVQLHTASVGGVELRNLQGQLIKEIGFRDADFLDLEMPHCPAGTYFVRVQTEQGQTVKKLLLTGY